MDNALSKPAATDYNNVVAANIRAELARNGLNQAQAATALGVNEMWISRRLKSGTPLDSNDIAMFARFLKVSIGTLFEETKKATGGGAPSGLSLPDLDSNQEPAGFKPAPIVRLSDRRGPTHDSPHRIGAALVSAFPVRIEA